MNTRFEDVYALLRARGLVHSKVSLDGLRSSDKGAIVDAFSALLNQLDEEADLRGGLLARNQALESHIERMRRTHKQDDGRMAGVETKLNQAKAKLHEQSAHRATHEQLARAQRIAQQTKVAALQHRAATERTTERMRERLAAVSMTNIKSLLPDIRIASTSFEAHEATVQDSIASQQLEDLEKRHITLMEAGQASKQLVVDAINTMRLADHQLEGAMRSGRPDLDCEPPLLEQRDVFPPMQPLALSDTAATHPAKQHMQDAIEALEDRVDDVSRRVMRQSTGKDDDSALKLDDLCVSRGSQSARTGKAQRVLVSRDALRDLNGSDSKRRRVGII